jgi:hypothetical protein
VESYSIVIILLPLTGVAFLIFWVALLIRMVIIFRHKIHTKKQYMFVAERVKNMNKKEIRNNCAIEIKYFPHSFVFNNRRE